MGVKSRTHWAYRNITGCCEKCTFGSGSHAEFCVDTLRPEAAAPAEGQGLALRARIEAFWREVGMKEEYIKPFVDELYLAASKVNYKRINEKLGGGESSMESTPKST